MPTCTLRIRPPRYYSLTMTCHAHGWKYLAPFDWDDDRDSLSLVLAVGAQTVDIHVRQANERIVARVDAHTALTPTERTAVRRAVIRALDLERDTEPLLARARRIDARLARLVRQGAGRLLRAPSLWEDAAKTLFTTNCSWALTTRMAQAACAPIFAAAAPSGRHPFFAPAAVTRHAQRLNTLLPVGYRGRYLAALARAFDDGGPLAAVTLERLPHGAAQARVNTLAGFGPYATDHLLVLSGFFNRIPVDTVVTGYIKSRYRARNITRFIETHYAPWGEYRWWGMRLERMAARFDSY